LLTGVILCPGRCLAHFGIGEIVLVEIIQGPAGLGGIGNDITVLVKEKSFPVITTNDITDIAPGISVRGYRYSAEREAGCGVF